MMWQQLLGSGGLRERLSEFACDLQSGTAGCSSEAAKPRAQVLAFGRSTD
jgi:hypothetical protein